MNWFILWMLMLIAGGNHAANSAPIKEATDKCEVILSVMSNNDAKKIESLFEHRRRNNGQLKFSNEIEKIAYTLEPKRNAVYHVSWKIRKGPYRNVRESGNLICELPSEWQVTLTPRLNLVYPPASHGLREETIYQQIETIVGIYLGKSKISLHPDVVRIMWHLSQKMLPENLINKIIESSPFLSFAAVSVVIQDIVKKAEVQLVALRISHDINIDKGEQKWLLTNAQDQKAIREGRYSTEHSLHNSWLPWFNKTHAEFFARTAYEAYQKTIVAPLAQTKIFDRSSGSFILDPIGVTDKMQAIYDLIAPYVYNMIEDGRSLFIHLLMQSDLAYELLTFEAFLNGDIELLMRENFMDPSQIGLPSAQKLGFAL